MKKVKIISSFLFLIITLAITYAFANNQKSDVKVHSTTEFQIIDSVINNLTSTQDISDILVVLDIDNTILTSSTDLGGDIWYQWQQGELSIKPTDEQKVECLFEDAIGLLYELGTMKLTEIAVPKIINSWQEKGITVFALTSRSPKYRAATERELERNQIDFTKTALGPSNEKLPVYRYDLEREVSYMKGIMMTSGLNKGKMLQDILQRTDKSFNSIIFVDDSKKNITNMELEFKNSNINMTVFQYDKVVEDRKVLNGGVVLTKEQAEKMDSDWKNLNKTLKIIFPDRYIDNECLGSN